MEFGGFGLGLVECGEGGVGVLPQLKEVFVGGEGAGAGEVGVGALCGFGEECVGAGYAEIGERAGPAVPGDAGVVEDFLELGGGFLALAGGEIGLAADVGWI